MRIDMDTKKMIPGTGYGVAISPVDGTVWETSPQAGGPANKMYMLDPKTGKFKDYPLPPPGRFPHGIDFSTDGNVWVSLGSGQLGRLNPQDRPVEILGHAGTKIQGHRQGNRQHRFPLLPLGRSIQRVGARQGHRDRHWNHFGRNVHI